MEQVGNSYTSALDGSSDFCSSAGFVRCCSPAWQRPTLRILQPLIWFTKGASLEWTSVLIISSLLEAFLTLISWLDAAFKGFSGGVDVSPTPHLAPFKIVSLLRDLSGREFLSSFVTGLINLIKSFIHDPETLKIFPGTDNQETSYPL